MNVRKTRKLILSFRRLGKIRRSIVSIFFSFHSWFHWHTDTISIRKMMMNMFSSVLQRLIISEFSYWLLHVYTCGFHHDSNYHKFSIFVETGRLRFLANIVNVIFNSYPLCTYLKSERISTYKECYGNQRYIYIYMMDIWNYDVYISMHQNRFKRYLELEHIRMLITLDTVPSQG